MSRTEPKKSETLEIRVSHETKQRLGQLAEKQNSTVSELVRSQVNALLSNHQTEPKLPRRHSRLRAGLVGTALVGLFSMSVFQGASADNIVLSIEGEYLRSQIDPTPTETCEDGVCHYDLSVLDHIDPDNYDPTTTWKSTLSTQVEINDKMTMLELPLKISNIKIILYAKVDDVDNMGKSVVTRIKVVELGKESERVLSEPEIFTSLGGTSNFKSSMPGMLLDIDLTAKASGQSAVK